MEVDDRDEHKGKEESQYERYHEGTEDIERCGYCYYGQYQKADRLDPLLILHITSIIKLQSRVKFYIAARHAV